MFNLLPDSLKNEIKSEYKLRRLILLLVFMLCLQVSFLIFIFPSWLVSLYRDNEAILQTEKMDESSLVGSVGSTTDIIKAINTKLNIVNTALQYPKLVPLVNTILSKKTSSIRINQFAYTSNSATTGVLNIQGVSGTRESLVEFVKSLQDSKVFKTVDSPISNLAKDKNIVFSISMNISQ